MINETLNFTNKRNQSIFYQTWKNESDPNWVAIFVHGQGEHSGRYAEIAEYFTEKNAAVYSLDHVGHGKSAGKRGCIMRFSDYTEDLDILVNMAKKNTPDLPLVLVGHSLGGLIAADYAAQHPEKLNLMVLSSPLFKLKLEVPAVKRVVGNLLSNILPKLTLGNEIDPAALSTDPENAVRYANDPLVHNQVSTRWFTEMTSRMNFIHENTKLLKNPILIMHGGNDPVLDPDGSKQIHEKLQVVDKKLKIWEGMYHEIFNEIERNSVFDYAYEWIQPRLNGESARG